MVHFCAWQGPSRPIGGHQNHDVFLRNEEIWLALQKISRHFTRADKTWLLSSAVNKRSTSSNSLGKFAFFVLSNQFSHDFTHWSWEMCIEPQGITLRLITNSLHFWIKIEVIQLCIWGFWRRRSIYTQKAYAGFSLYKVFNVLSEKRAKNAPATDWPPHIFLFPF